MSTRQRRGNIRSDQPRLQRTESVLTRTTALSRNVAAPRRTAGTHTTGAPAVRAGTADPHTTEALDRDALLDRLHQLRKVLPAFAQELADVRRAAAKLRVDNRRLLDEVHRLQKERG